MAGFVEKRNGPLSTGKRPFTLSDGLKRLSSFGMFYDDLVLRQSQAIGPTEDAFGYVTQLEIPGPPNLVRSDPALRKNILIVDDINDSGATFNWIKEQI